MASIVLEASVQQQDKLAEALMGTFGGLGGVDLDPPERAARRRPPEFDSERPSSTPASPHERCED